MGARLAALVPATIIALATLAGGVGARAETVVELFTSEGCSSCPPADALLGELAERDDLLALSFHVDYWDYIGWKDRFAEPAFTERQRAYAKTMGLRYVYTPQMVIDGQKHVTGSNRAKVMNAIGEARNHSGVPVSMRHIGTGVIGISIPEAGGDEKGVVWLVTYLKERVTQVRRGENRGRTLRHRNIVRGLHRIGTWEGRPLDLTVEVAEPGGGGGCGVILQSTHDGRILGAAKLTLN